jgi:hypothetical protein
MVVLLVGKRTGRIPNLGEEKEEICNVPRMKEPSAEARGELSPCPTPKPGASQVIPTKEEK